MHRCFQMASDNNGYEDQLIKITRTPYTFRHAEERFQWVERYLSNYAKSKQPVSFGWQGERKETEYYEVNYKSDLLERLLMSVSITNWMDIEGVFYEQMIAILDNTKGIKAKEDALQKLNESMRSVISELQIYLSDLTAPNKINSYDDIIYSRIDDKDIQSKPIKYRTAANRPFETSTAKETLILNFNYTDTISNYLSKPGYKSPIRIFIHGELNNLDNPIIFGFGDEVDRRYEDIENSRAQGWFEYIKSFWYLKTNNYRDLTSFIDSDEYQVLVLGHSCGLSDRTMLQMIFQHDNCRSIKLYYFGDKESNNYKQTLHEVARHFKDKGLMRRRIVSEEKSQRMPQYND